MAKKTQNYQVIWPRLRAKNKKEKTRHRSGSLQSFTLNLYLMKKYYPKKSLQKYCQIRDVTTYF